jgi:hypothetical protein
MAARRYDFPVLRRTARAGAGLLPRCVAGVRTVENLLTLG